MTSRHTSTLYLRLRKHLSLRSGEPVTLGDAAQMLAEPQLEAELRRLVLAEAPAGEQYILIDMLMIVAAVQERYPDLQIEYYGEPHVLVQWQKESKIRGRHMLFPVVLFLLFVGSGLTIMNFHADVSMLEVHRKLYKMITGVDHPHPLLLQIPYSLGLGAGMLLFFNRVFKKKINEEPDPLEVEMFLYEENVRQYMVRDEYNRLKDPDADERK